MCGQRQRCCPGLNVILAFAQFFLCRKNIFVILLTIFKADATLKNMTIKHTHMIKSITVLVAPRWHQPKGSVRFVGSE
jgi:hypothetical protein